MAAYHPSINLLGISTVHGNSSLEHTTVNAGSVLTAIGRPDVPVYAGAAKGLVRPACHAPDIHGESGLDGTELLPKPLVSARRDIPAIEAMAETLLSTPAGEAWLIATGALTNIAMLLEKHPQIARHIRGLSIMGGAVGGGFTDAVLGKVGDRERFGNWTPYAEFNIVCDPEAAAAVLSTTALAEKTVLIPLDVTHLVLATPEVQDLLLYGPGFPSSASESKPSALRMMFLELLNFFAHTYATVFGIEAGPPLHDPLAVATILDGLTGIEIPFYDDVNGVTNGARYRVSVLVDGTHDEAVRGSTQTGRTVVEQLPLGIPGVRIPRGLRISRFWKVLEECLERADEHNTRLTT